MQTPVKRNRQPPRSWLVPAIVAAILLIGAVAGNLVASYVQTSLDPYRRWVWIGFAIAVIVAIAAAIREANRNHPAQEINEPSSVAALVADVPREVTASGSGSVAIGRDVSDANIVTGAGNVALNATKVGGDVVGRDKVTHIHEATSAPTALHQLRAPVGDFVGRADEMARLMTALQAGDHIGINGMGGTGKTELALLIAERITSEYPDGQLLINLQGTDAQPRKPEEALGIFIRAFLGPEAPLPDDLDQLTQLCRSQLSNKRVLLVLDNAAESAQVRPLLPPAGCVLVVTSRQPVTLPGMISLTLNPFTALEARQLLLEIAPDAAPVAEQICQLCGYLPLAIRAAGSLLALTVDLDPLVYASQLKEERTRLQRLGGEGVDVGVEASFNLSYARLDSEAAKVFRRLAVFPATFDVTAAEKICDDPGHTQLSNLVRRSLVLYDSSAKRYRLHDLVRLFADARLGDDERAEGQELHAAHYQTVLADAGRLYLEGGENIRSALTLFDLEWRNIEAGQAWAQAEASRGDEAARLCIAYPDVGAYVLSLRQHARDQIRWLEVALGAAQRLRVPDWEANALGNLGNAYADLAQPRRAIEFYEKQLVIARKIGNRIGEGMAVGNLGNSYNELGETKRAIELFEQRLSIAREIGDRRGEGNALGNLGIAYTLIKELKRGIEFHNQALVVLREIGDRRGEAEVLGNLGTAFAHLDDTKRAIELHEQALCIHREIGNRKAEARALGNLGNAFLRLGETERAVGFYDQDLAIARDVGNVRGEGIVLFNKSLALHKLGKRAQAIACVEAALGILERIEDPQAETARAQLAQWRTEAAPQESVFGEPAG